MKNILDSEFAEWDRRYRGHFINTLSGFKPVSLVGTWNANGTANLAVFSNIVHVGADPALIGMVSRPIAAGGHTMINIENTRWFTVNHIHPGMMERAHQCSARYEAGMSELDAAGFTLFEDKCVHAPFVNESNIRLGIELHQIIPVDINQTFFIVGHVRSVWMDENILNDDGFIDLVEAKSLCSSGLDSYHTVAAGIRFPYAKVN